MVELITDRTQYHVTLLNRLRKKPWSSMTTAERNSWNGEAAKGAYNYTDLNRVETAVGELAAELGLSLTTKTNWTLWDIPTRSQMERYLSNVVAIRNACPDKIEFPALPSTMNGLGFTGANSIERVLELAYKYLNGDFDEHECVLGEFILGECTLDGESGEEPDIPDIPDIPDDPGNETEHECVLGEFVLGECTLDGSGSSGGDPDIPGGSGSSDFIRSGEIYCGEVL